MENNGLKFTKEQRQILPGLLLGDAHLETSNNGKSYRLRFCQGEKHKEYIFHLYEIFQKWTLSPPRQKSDNTWVFDTIVTPSLNFYGKQFYDSSKKRKLPKLISKLLTPRGLAYWYMDDGSLKSFQSKGCIYNTHAYTKKEVETLCSILSNKFQLKAKPRKQSKGLKIGYQIYISGYSYEVFSNLIFKYLHKTMHYKFPTPRKVSRLTPMPKE